MKLPNLLTAFYLSGAGLWAGPPVLPETRSAAALDFQQQATIPNLPRAYITSSPADLKDGLPVGRLEIPGSAKAIGAFRQSDAQGQFANNNPDASITYCHMSYNCRTLSLCWWLAGPQWNEIFQSVIEANQGRENTQTHWSTLCKQAETKNMSLEQR